jgi:hypothetical protein
MDSYVQKGAEDEMLQECSTLKRGPSRTPHGGGKSKRLASGTYIVRLPQASGAFPLCCNGSQCD